MSSRKIPVPKRRRNVSIRDRLSKHDKLRHSVRWIEDVDGRPRRFERSFPTREDADKFAKKCQLMLGIVHEAKATIGERLLKAGDLRLLIAHFVAEKLEKRVASKMLAEDITREEAKKDTGDSGERWLLETVPDDFKWEKTTDIPPTALGDIESKLSYRGSYVVRKTQAFMRALVRRFRKEFTFNEEILEGKLCSHAEEDCYVWLDAEKDLILRELTAPLRIPPELATWSTAKRSAERRRAGNELGRRRALFLVIWPQLLWALRPREAALLRVRDWNPVTDELTVRVTKNRKPRRFVVDLITATMLNRLTQGRPSDDFIYTTARGKPWRGYELMSYQFRGILKKLGLQGSLYSCRHYAATTLAELMPKHLPSVMAITGHKSMAILQRYVLAKGNRMTPAAGEYNHVYRDVLQRFSAGIVKAASEAGPLDPCATATASQKAGSPTPSTDQGSVHFKMEEE